MKKKTIALIYGGRSPERKISLHSGNQVFNALDKSKYNIIKYDSKTDISQLVANASEINAALIILHGHFGEDGTVQGLLDLLDIPYQGSGVLGSAVAMNKLISKQLYAQSGIPVPPYIALTREDVLNPADCVTRLGLPLVIKPVSSGSSIGMSIVKTESSLKNAVKIAFEYDTTILIESYIEGTELTCAVIGNDTLKALPIVEIIPDKKYDFFDFKAKYTSGETEESCPARISDNLTKKAQTFAKIAHKALFLYGYSRTDMILKNQNIYVLETNTIPGMTSNSLLPVAAKAAGISFTRLLDMLIELSIKRHEKK